MSFLYSNVADSVILIILPAGKIVSRVTNDTEAIRDLCITVLATFVSSIIYIIRVFAAYFYSM